MDKFVGCKISPEKKRKKQVESKNLKKSRKKTTEKKTKTKCEHTLFHFPSVFSLSRFLFVRYPEFYQQNQIKIRKQTDEKNYTHNNENTLTEKKTKQIRP